MNHFYTEEQTVFEEEVTTPGGPAAPGGAAPPPQKKWVVKKIAGGLFRRIGRTGKKTTHTTEYLGTDAELPPEMRGEW